MTVNFDIVDNYALSFEGRHIDLHNNFEFAGFDYNVKSKEINLRWEKSIGDWVDKNELSSLVLTHKTVTFFKALEQDTEGTCDDASCLSEITFFPSAERNLNDCMIPQPKPSSGDDILYFFGNGQCIRICCDLIELRVYIDLNKENGI